MTVLAPEWLEGIAQFNDREYYACHDTLEALWMEAIDPDKKFYQGVLQIAVACYHLHNHNWQGAAILLGEGMGRLRYYQPVYGEIDVSELLQQSNNLLQLLQTVGSEGVVDFVERLRQDPTPLPVLKFFTNTSCEINITYSAN
jgi:uncharacterized protein